jgi:hypothetical protein
VLLFRYIRQEVLLWQQNLNFLLFFSKVKEILAEYDPNFMAMSLDEAYLNITQHLQERQDWPEDKRRYFIKMGNYLKIGKQCLKSTNYQLTESSSWNIPS